MLIVQKFGGTSVGDLEKIKNVANRVIKSKKDGHDLVVVVSAMSGETNKLTEYAQFFSKNPAKRELDILLSSGERVTASLLSIAFQEMGFKSIAMSGRQAGILTDTSHTVARINDIDTANIKRYIKEDNIIVLAGFQGINENGDVTTLGRGGSDLTAVAVAGALEADLCEIYTDVNGIYTTDPRIENKAKKIEKISYDEMLELASLGAKVLQTRSVEMAKKLNVNLVTRSSFTNEEGTLITTEESIMEKPLVSGIALDRNQARVSIRGVDDSPGMASDFFKVFTKENINIDMIIQNVGHDGKTNIGFTTPKTEMEKIKIIMKQFADVVDMVEYDDSVSKVSIVGVGMKSHSGVASKAFETLANEKINIEMISTSEIKISMIVNEKYSELAVKSLHEAYELDK